jgi:hypothetical protein
MTMVSSGPISLAGNATTGGLNQSVNIELGRSATATINMNESAVRGLAGVPSGAISMSNFYGKANEFPFTISSNQTDANLRTLAVNAGWNQVSRPIATINSGVFIFSTSTGTPALTINGSFPNGVTLINNGTILGRGGNGGNGASGFAGSAGSTGGLALSVSVAVTINNGSGTIAGGGGGGGGSGSYTNSDGNTSGSGGGGGRGNGPGGGVPGTAYPQTGAPGGAGTLTAAGPGGVGNPLWNHIGGNGGGGGASGSPGGPGTSAYCAPGGPGGGGGGGGGCITGNSNITYIATGTRLGSIS